MKHYFTLKIEDLELLIFRYVSIFLYLTCQENVIITDHLCYRRLC